MWDKLRKNFNSGIERIKWFSSLLSERLKIEYSVVRLLYQSEKMERKKDEQMRRIGQRVYELKGYSDRYILKDGVIKESLSELDKIINDIEVTRKRASEISKVEE